MNRKMRKGTIILCLVLGFTVLLADTEAHAGILGGILGGIGRVAGGLFRGIGGALGGIVRGAGGLLGNLFGGGGGGGGGILGFLTKIIGGLVGGGNNMMGMVAEAKAPVEAVANTANEATTLLKQTAEANNQTEARTVQNPDDEGTPQAAGKAPNAEELQKKVKDMASNVDSKISGIEQVLKSGLPAEPKAKLEQVLNDMKTLKDALQASADGKAVSPEEIDRLQKNFEVSKKYFNDLIEKGQLVLSGLKSLGEGASSLQSMVQSFGS